MKLGHGRRRAAVAAAALAAGLGLTGCHLGTVNLTGASRAVGRAERQAKANKATVSNFTAALKTGAPSTFEVTYVTTGPAPTRVVYAVAPPDDLAFSETPVATPGRAQVQLVSNSSGEYSCQSGVGSAVTCSKLGKLDAAGRNAIIDVYTPQHWVSLLDGFSLAASFVGGKVSLSTMTVNGFALHCINVKTTSSSQLNTICTTPQNLLGYAKLAGSTTAFEIKSYSVSPSPGLFTLPRGATVTTPSSQAG
jgi:hypothetical protein